MLVCYLNQKVNDAQNKNEGLNTLGPTLWTITIPEAAPVDEPHKIEDPSEDEQVEQSHFLVALF